MQIRVAAEIYVTPRASHILNLTLQYVEGQVRRIEEGNAKV